jgi:hypothetical protein
MNKAARLIWVSLILASAQARAGVSVPESAAAPVRFGAKVLREALARKGGTTVLISLSAERLAAGPESYRISTEGGAITVAGSDDAGLMYGAIDLADQIDAASAGDLVRAVKPVRKAPFLAIRGINMFLTAQGFDDPNSWFWSDTFWESFLDMMARTHHNFLDLHGPFDITVGWPNGFSYLLYLPDFPEVGVGRERAAKNMARFRQVLDMAADRGVKVGFMNYSAAPPIGPWETGRFWQDGWFDPHPRKLVEGARVEAYTRRAVAEFLKAVPELWMFGFRIGESGQPEDFYKRTYLEALKDAPASLNVYVRTWVADPAKVREIAGLLRQRFYIEPKYNGEHLGLPYQAVLGGRYYTPSGSYEDYTNPSRNLSIIWQMRANGTHRIFHWGSPEFARRTVLSAKFGGGQGFSMEPMNAYYPETDYLHNNPRTDHSYYRWMHERQWYWFLLWGRTAYDPNVSESVWLNEFDRRFGQSAGPLVYRALAESSKVVPFIFAYHNQGLDHMHMAPEYETGDHSLAVRNVFRAGGVSVPRGGGNDEFLGVDTLDRTAMADPISYVEERLKGTPSGRFSPFDAADYLRTAGDDSEKWMAQAAAAASTKSKEFDCIRQDIAAVAALARYYAERITSVTHLEFYQRTLYHPELTAARESLERAIGYWDRLSEITDRHYGYVPELIRMQVYQFRWREEGRGLGADMEDLNRREAEFRSWNWENSRFRTMVGHIPPEQARAGEPMKLSASIAAASPDMKLALFFRKPGAAGYTRMEMTPENRGTPLWVAEIPAGAMRTGTLEYYFGAYGGTGIGYGGTLDTRQPYSVKVVDRTTKPSVTHVPPAGTQRGERVRLTVQVEDLVAVESVQVHYKLMPSYYGWLTIDMRPSGDGAYTADVPLTSEGILYYFTAVDSYGSAVNYPNFLKQTPYFAIEPWAPAPQQAFR